MWSILYIIVFRGVFVVLKLFIFRAGGYLQISKISCLGEGDTCVVQCNIHTLKSLIFIPFKKYISHRCQFYSDFVCRNTSYLSSLCSAAAVWQIPIPLLLNEWDLHTNQYSKQRRKHSIKRWNNTVTWKQPNNVIRGSVNIQSLLLFVHFKPYLHCAVRHKAISEDEQSHKSSIDTLFLKWAKCKMLIELNN